MPHRFWLTLLVLAALVMPPAPGQAAAAQGSTRAFSRPEAPAGGIVGDGTPLSCTEGALDTALAGGGAVTFSCGGPKFFFLSAAKTITQSTTIDGAGGITLDGIDSFAIFSVMAGVTLSLKNITLNQAYGGLSDGGAIKNHGTLRLDHSVIQSSRTDSNHSGGAIFSDGPVFISDSVLQDNQAGSGGAVFANLSNAIVTISNSTFSGNQAINTTTGYGGAIWVGQQARVSITGGAIISNSAKFGGGLFLSQNATVTLTSAGAPAIVSGNTATGAGGGAYNGGGSVTLTNATLSGNSAVNGSHVTTFGGGIDNVQGAATLTNATLVSNSADYGGGIYNAQGVLTLTGGTLSGNSATVLGGGIGNESGSVALTDATLSGNSARAGGGLSNDHASGVATLTRVTLSGNQALFDGGGLFNKHGAATLANVVLSGNVVSNTFSLPTYGGGIENYGMLTVTNATLSGNTVTNNIGSSGFGGGIYNNQYNSQDTLTLINSTLSGNSAYAGGGILNVGTLTLTNSTVSGNSATGTGGGLENYEGSALLTNATLSGNSANLGGGLYEYSLAPTQTITLKNTLIASGPSGANCTDDLGTLGFITSAGYNLSNEGTCAPHFNHVGDLNNENPNLGPLANNGGPTLTHMPSLPSKAIDAIPLGTNSCGTTLTSDQRGAPRPHDGRCDIGAVESAWAYPRLWLALLRR